MLDRQRQRYAPQHQADIGFARLIVWAHVAMGLLSAALLMFHEMFTTSILALLWFLVSIGGLAGVLRQRQWCRIALGLFFFIGAGLGLYYLLWHAPTLDPTATPLLSRRLLPFWLSSFAFAYAAGGLVMLISSRMQRATARGFSMWDRVTY